MLRTTVVHQSNGWRGIEVSQGQNKLIRSVVVSWASVIQLRQQPPDQILIWKRHSHKTQPPGVKFPGTWEQEVVPWTLFHQLEVTKSARALHMAPQLHAVAAMLRCVLATQHYAIFKFDHWYQHTVSDSLTRAALQPPLFQSDVFPGCGSLSCLLQVRDPSVKKEAVNASWAFQFYGCCAPNWGHHSFPGPIVGAFHQDIQVPNLL